MVYDMQFILLKQDPSQLKTMATVTKVYMNYKSYHYEIDLIPNGVDLAVRERFVRYVGSRDDGCIRQSPQNDVLTCRLNL